MDFLVYYKKGAKLAKKRFCARDEQVLEDMLAAKGKELVEIKRLRVGGNPLRVPGKSVLQFFAKMRICCKIGMPIVDALKLCSELAASKKFRGVLADLHSSVSMGKDISESMWKYPNVFSPTVCRLMEVGSVSGTLAQTCDKIFYTLNIEMGAKRKIIGTLYYPALVLAALVLAAYILVSRTIPAFLSLFEGSGVALPLPTRMLMRISGCLSEHPYLGALAFFGILAFIFSIPKIYERSFAFQRLVLKMPAFSSLILYSQRLSLCSSLYTILGSGVPILKALRMTRNSLSNVEFKKAVASAAMSVYAGRGMGRGFAKHSAILGDDIVKSMEFGENTGTLGEVLGDLRDDFESDLEYQIHMFKESINPLITLVIALAVLFILLALFLPMFSMSQAISA